MVCPRCGTQVTPTASWCPRCGFAPPPQLKAWPGSGRPSRLVWLGVGLAAVVALAVAVTYGTSQAQATPTPLVQFGQPVSINRDGKVFYCDGRQGD
jgi:hypothetical protein